MTTNVVLKSASWLAVAKASNSGPRRTRIGGGAAPSAGLPVGQGVSSGGTVLGKTTTRCRSAGGLRSAAPTGIWSPARRALPWYPPKPERRSVPRPPSSSGTSRPPATASDDRQPCEAQEPLPSVAPSGTQIGCQAGTGVDRPSAVTTTAPTAAPVIATHAPVGKTSRGPRRVISSAAASVGLPTRRLATRCESVSTAPPGLTPLEREPWRPRSWMVVSIPGAATSIVVIGFAPQHEERR